MTVIAKARWYINSHYAGDISLETVATALHAPSATSTT